MEDIPLYIGKRKNILVLSGGGVKGLATLGALKCLMDNEIIIKPDIICGTSCGSIIGLFIIIGWSPFDIYNLLLSIDFSQLIQPDYDNIFEDTCFGFNTTDPIMHIVIKMLEKKNIEKKITFKELYDKFKVNLIITGSCVNDANPYYFSKDTKPDMQVLKAIRISISVPILFKPYKYDNKIWIDGGCIDNYPIQLFHDRINDVIGILLDDYNEYIDNIDEIDKYIMRIFKCLNKSTILYKYEKYQKNTIHIKCKFDTNINWQITNEQKQYLWNQGIDATTKFISGF